MHYHAASSGVREHFPQRSVLEPERSTYRSDSDENEHRWLTPVGLVDVEVDNGGAQAPGARENQKGLTNTTNQTTNKIAHWLEAIDQESQAAVGRSPYVCSVIRDSSLING